MTNNLIKHYSSARSKYQNHIFEIGLVFVLVGVQLGTAIRNVIPAIEIVNVLMMMGVILTIDYRNLINIRFYKYKLLAFVLLFNSIAFIYAILSSGTKYPELHNQIVLMQLFIFALIVGLSTNLNRRIELVNFDRYLFYVTGFISLVILYQSTRGFTGIYLENVFADAATDSNHMAEGGDKTTMGRVLYLSIITTVIYKSRNVFELLLKPVLIFSAFFGLYMFNTRASIVLSFLSLFIYYYKYIYKNGRVKKKVSVINYLIIIVTVVIALIYFYNTNFYFKSIVDLIYTNISNGISSYFGDNKDDVSAMIRKQHLRIVSPLIIGSSIFQLLFGHGFVTFFVDIPIIQAFLDLGLFGFIFYFISLIVLPIIFIFKKRYNNTHLIIIQLFAFHYLVDQIYAGMPYWSFQFCPIILLIFFDNYNKTYRK